MKKIIVMKMKNMKMEVNMLIKMKIKQVIN